MSTGLRELRIKTRDVRQKERELVEWLMATMHEYNSSLCVCALPKFGDGDGDGDGGFMITKRMEIESVMAISCERIGEMGDVGRT